MSPEDLDAMCKAALFRLHAFINHSAGQHLRRMKESWGRSQ